jgi:hypothetical protein
MCSSCPVPTWFPTKNQLNYHVGLEHQETAWVKFKDGRIRKFQRDQDDGLFHCSCRSYQTANAELLRKHAARHDLPVDAEDSGDPESVVAAALETFGCVHLPEYGVLICLGCQCALRPDRIASHLRTVHDHQSQMAKSAARLFSEHLQLRSLAELESPPYFLPPISHLPVKNGLICTRCNGYCCITPGTMEKHARKVHGWKAQDEVAWEACKVQTFF